MIERITLDIRKDEVIVKRRKYKIIDGVEKQVGNLITTSYINSIRGRRDVEKDLEEKYVLEIFAVWGDEPTIIEEEDK